MWSSRGLAPKSAFLMRLLQCGGDVASCLLMSVHCEIASVAEVRSFGFRVRFPYPTASWCKLGHLRAYRNCMLPSLASLAAHAP